jgi:hypothetical protein
MYAPPFASHISLIRHVAEDEGLLSTGCDFRRNAVISTDELADMLRRNLAVIDQQANGLTHAESVMQLPFRGNCFNWVVGHLVVHRDKMLKVMNAAPQWDEAKAARYDRESPPITGLDSALPFENLLADLRQSQGLLEAALAKLTDETLDAMQPDGRRTLRGRLLFLAWHETYHVGQTELLRQLTGVNDKVI